MSRVTFSNLIGQSQAFRETVRLIQRIAETQAPVLIEGETGTGKEVAARAIHYGGPRRDRAFVPVNCGAIPEALIENELFGHKRGAFTDARSDWVGLLRLAHGGTLFLDEVDALTPKAQVVLLRFLQDQKFRPLGSSLEHTADVRIIAASNRSLAQLAEEGGFRIDLLFRLKVLFLVLPPLRERDGDVLLLAGHFVAECSSRYGMGRKRFTPGVGSVLESYGWPGNVRELENFVHREFLLADGDLISVTDPSMQHMGGRQERATAENYRAAKAEAISRFDRGFLLRLMARTNGNVSAAAAQAGKERRALGKLLKKYGIDPRGFRDA
jgi:transcriptional regulator with GAF, ATPase, and Fis domain